MCLVCVINVLCVYGWVIQDFGGGVKSSYFVGDIKWAIRGASIHWGGGFECEMDSLFNCKMVQE